MSTEAARSVAVAWVTVNLPWAEYRRGRPLVGRLIEIASVDPDDGTVSTERTQMLLGDATTSGGRCNCCPIEDNSLVLRELDMSLLIVAAVCEAGDDATPLDFLAHQLYLQSCNGAFGVRWMCMHADLKTKWRGEARRAFDRWASDENAAAEARRTGAS